MNQMCIEAALPYCKSLGNGELFLTDGLRQEEKEEPPIDSLRLGAFLIRAGRTMNALLEEERSERQEVRDSKQSSKHSTMVLSESFRELEAIPMLKG